MILRANVKVDPGIVLQKEKTIDPDERAEKNEVQFNLFSYKGIKILFLILFVFT